MKKTIWIIVIAFIALCVLGYFAGRQKNQKPTSVDYKNATYEIDGQSVVLVKGKSEVATAPGSSSRTITEYFGNEAIGDLNGDGVSDVAFILTQTSGGSGTFYY